MKPIMVGYKPPSAFLKMRQNRVNHERAKLQREEPQWTEIPLNMSNAMAVALGIRAEPDDEPKGPLQ
jgi:hypothetical protein